MTPDDAYKTTKNICTVSMHAIDEIMLNGDQSYDHYVAKQYITGISMLLDRVPDNQLIFMKKYVLTLSAKYGARYVYKTYSDVINDIQNVTIYCDLYNLFFGSNYCWAFAIYQDDGE